eukprot:SAG11_NODE_2298_length_3552_cov_11.614538_6_plen_298_part_00
MPPDVHLFVADDKVEKILSEFGGHEDLWKAGDMIGFRRTITKFSTELGGLMSFNMYEKNLKRSKNSGSNVSHWLLNQPTGGLHFKTQHQRKLLKFMDDNGDYLNAVMLVRASGKAVGDKFVVEHLGWENFLADALDKCPEMFPSPHDTSETCTHSLESRPFAHLSPFVRMAVETVQKHIDVIECLRLRSGPEVSTVPIPNPNMAVTLNVGAHKHKYFGQTRTSCADKARNILHMDPKYSVYIAKAFQIGMQISQVNGAFEAAAKVLDTSTHGLPDPRQSTTWSSLWARWPRQNSQRH